MEHRGGWEFPLSREEKKQRVMYLFQAELAEAEQTNAENNEEIRAETKERRKLQALLAKRAVPVADGAPTATNLAPTKRSSQARLESVGLGLLAGLTVIAIAWLCQSPAVVPVIPSTTNATMPVDQAQAETSLSPGNITDRVMGMRSEGHVRLQLSNCQEAEWWFASALKVLAEGNITSAYRNHLLGERGFALVCSQRFADGAKILEEHMEFIGFQGESHLLNALGYATFHLQEFVRSAAFFELSIRADKLNPVPWNNFAAAQIMAGDLGAANEALYQAAENVKQLNVHQDHHANVVSTNAAVLNAHSRGEVDRLPWVEIWNGYLYDR